MNAYVCVCMCVVHFWGVGRSIILFSVPLRLSIETSFNQIALGLVIQKQAP